MAGEIQFSFRAVKPDGRKNKPIKWIGRTRKWAEGESERHYCNCGCGKPIKVKWGHYYVGIPKYLRGHHPNSSTKGKFKNDEREFWTGVEKTPKCWNWIKGKTHSGYGRFHFQGRRVFAHHLSWFFSHGSWPTLFVCHKCDNPACIRPDHLFEGTQLDNMRDAAKKGRINTKFSRSIVLKVVKMRRMGRTEKQVSAKLGISEPMVGRIMRGLNWSHLTGIPKRV